MKALITGITGQDGSYLAEFLLEMGWEVHGLVRRSSSFSTGRIDHIFDDVTLHYGDVLDSSSLSGVMLKVKPDHIYNLAAQSHVRVSYDQPVYTGDATGLGAMKMLEAYRTCCPKARYYQAGSSEMFGGLQVEMQDEATPFHPRSPYACAKVYAHWATVNYREAYGLHASNGILFNHESPRRGETFVTRKITRALTRIKLGLQSKVRLGNLDSKRDWGFAGDYVRAMYYMLHADSPGDFVIATGRTMTVRWFLEQACMLLNLTPEYVVDYDHRLTRPAEVDYLHGDASKAQALLNWRPAVDVEKLVEMMVESDMELAHREKKALA